MIGAIGAILAIIGLYALEIVSADEESPITFVRTEQAHIDDPVSAVPVHLFASAWGTIAVGLFGRDNMINSLQVHN